jgi:NAD(P)-dependent dehydrogenase (short-subunit alcohol dehydrogenase family)
MGELDGKVALVTGASGSLGTAVVATLAGAGASVALTDRNPDKLRGVHGAAAPVCGLS